MKKVVIVAPVHSYDDVRVFQKEAKTLASYGYKVTLLARTAKLLVEKEVVVKPVPLASRRLVRFLKLPLVFQMALAEQADVYHLHNPDTLAIAIVLKLFGKLVIYDTHEDFSERILIRDWIPRLIRPIVAKLVASLEVIVARIVDISIATESNVQVRLGQNTLLVKNAPITKGDLIDKAYSFALTLSKQNDCLRLVYIGGISRIRGLFAMLEALAITNRETPCRLWLIGTISEDELAQAKNHSAWKFVDYLGLLPQWKAFGYVIKSDVGLVTYLNIGGHANAGNNKLYEYQVFGVPFIASDFKKWRNSIKGYSAGWFINPAEPATIASKIIWFAQNPESRKKMGEQGKAFVAVYNWELESLKLLEAYKKIIA